MAIIGVCGPVGSDMEEFCKQCVNTIDGMVVINANDNSAELLVKTMQSHQGDLIVYGEDIFLNEEIRAALNIKIFLDRDADLCLVSFLRKQSGKGKLDTLLDEYENTIKPKNERIRKSQCHADLVRPSTKSNEHLLNILRSTLMSEKNSDAVKHTSVTPFWKKSTEEKPLQNPLDDMQFSVS